MQQEQISNYGSMGQVRWGEESLKGTEVRDQVQVIATFFHKKMKKMEDNWDKMEKVYFLDKAQKCEITECLKRCNLNEKKDKVKS